MTKSIVWFRRDLRINDNPALTAACDNGDVIPVLLWIHKLHKKLQPGGASRWWLHHALQSLSESLDNKLIVEQGDAREILHSLANDYSAECLLWNRRYEPWGRKRDKEIEASFSDSSVQVKAFNGSLLWEPTQVAKKDGTPYKVFTPYYRKGCLQQEAPRHPLDKPTINFATDLPKNDE